MAITYDEAVEILDAALMADNPTKLNCGTHKEAINTRHRLNHWRAYNREQNKEIYHDKKDHPNYSKSVYDDLTLRVPNANEPDSSYIFIERRQRYVLEAAT
jgi:hypothetical protein